MNRPQFGLHRASQLRVEVAERLVEKEDSRPHGKRPGEPDALLLPARELARKAGFEAAQANELQRRRDPLAYLGRGEAAHAQTECDVLEARHVREERVALEDHSEIPPEGRDLVHAPAVDHHLAGVGRMKAGNEVQGGRLSAARRAEQRDELAVGHVEIDPLENLRRAEILRDGAKRQYVPGHCVTCFPPAVASAH
ncbi:MAG: hypothetical protein LT106_04650 [Burkholderiaceae bacterium]|nr:hypothetical protein [Burkholderiaceae bacterium]